MSLLTKNISNPFVQMKLNNQINYCKQTPAALSDFARPQATPQKILDDIKEKTATGRQAYNTLLIFSTNIKNIDNKDKANQHKKTIVKYLVDLLLSLGKLQFQMILMFDVHRNWRDDYKINAGYDARRFSLDDLTNQCSRLIDEILGI